MSQDQPTQDICKLGPTGKLLRRALPPVHAPAGFRAELLRRLVDEEQRAASPHRATPQADLPR
jgi:hypothetical protein